MFTQGSHKPAVSHAKPKAGSPFGAKSGYAEVPKAPNVQSQHAMAGVTHGGNSLGQPQVSDYSFPHAPGSGGTAMMNGPHHLNKGDVVIPAGHLHNAENPSEGEGHGEAGGDSIQNILAGNIGGSSLGNKKRSMFFGGK